MSSNVPALETGPVTEGEEWRSARCGRRVMDGRDTRLVRRFFLPSALGLSAEGESECLRLEVDASAILLLSRTGNDGQGSRHSRDRRSWSQARPSQKIHVQFWPYLTKKWAEDEFDLPTAGMGSRKALTRR